MERAVIVANILVHVFGEILCCLHLEGNHDHFKREISKARERFGKLRTNGEPVVGLFVGEGVVVC